MGILERMEKTFIEKTFENTVARYGAHCPVPIIDFETIAWWIAENMKNKLQANIAIMGENGIGKSFCALMVMKTVKQKLDPNWKLQSADNIVYAFQTHKDFISAVAEHKKEVILVDEAGELFSNRSQLNIENIQAYSFIEVSRENANAIIFASKDIHTLSYNLRNGKLTLIIILYDREDKGDVRAMGAVFMASAIMQGEDRFGLEPLTHCKGWDQWKLEAEKCPSFIGLIEVPDIKTMLDPDEIGFYAQKKREGINKLKQKRVDAMQIKEEFTSMRITFMRERMDELKAKKEALANPKAERHLVSPEQKAEILKWKAEVYDPMMKPKILGKHGKM